VEILFTSFVPLLRRAPLKASMLNLKGAAAMSEYLNETIFIHNGAPQALVGCLV
jgi:hypothetical protein